MPWSAVAGAAASYALNKAGGNSGVVQSNGSTSPWEPAIPYLGVGFQIAHQVLGDNMKNQDWRQLFSASQPALLNTVNGGYLNPSSNPYLKASVDDALGQAKSAFAGQYGGPAGQNLGNSGYQEALARGLGAVSTNAYNNAYQQERQNQLSAINGVPAFASAAQTVPFANVNNYMNVLNSASGGQQTSQTPYFQNNMAGALGGALLGYGLYNRNQGQAAPAGPVGGASMFADPYSQYSITY